jgi:hypothetical protein
MIEGQHLAASFQLIAGLAAGYNLMPPLNTTLCPRKQGTGAARLRSRNFPIVHNTPGTLIFIKMISSISVAAHLEHA